MLLEFDLKCLEIGPNSSFFQFLDFISAFTVNLEIWTASWQQFVKLHEQFCTNSGCQSRFNLILNLITAQINHLNWIEFQCKISRPHICSCSQPICLKFGLPLNNNLVKHPEKYGNNNRCISTNNLTVNPKNMPKFIIFLFSILYICPHNWPTWTKFVLHLGNNLKIWFNRW